MPRATKKAAGAPRAARKAATPKVTSSAGIKRPSAADVANAIATVNREKASAAEYNGMAGQASKAFCERWNVDKRAFAFVRKLAEMEPQKRQAMLIDLADLCKLMGFTDQGDFFVDVQGAVDGLAGDDADDGATSDEIKAATEADLAQAEPRMTQTFAETLHEQNKRVAREITDGIGEGRPN